MWAKCRREDKQEGRDDGSTPSTVKRVHELTSERQVERRELELVTEVSERGPTKLTSGSRWEEGGPDVREVGEQKSNEGSKRRKSGTGDVARVRQAYALTSERRVESRNSSWWRR